MRTANAPRTHLRAAAGLIDLPVPPLSLPTTENAYRLGEAVIMSLSDGSSVSGALLDFRADQSRLLVRLRAQTSVEAKEIFLKEIRTAHMQQERRIERMSSTLELRGKVVLPATRQEFEVVLDNDEKLTGHTFGFRIDQNGLHLYPAKESGAYTHLFISSWAIKSQRVGPLLGKALVDEELVTYDALAAELAEQHRLRAQPIGEYLKSAQLVTAAQLETALERQRLMPQVRVGEILVADGVITEAQLAEALHQQEKNRKLPLGEMLVSAGLVSSESVTQTLATKLGVPFVELREFAIDIKAVRHVGEKIARRLHVMPLYLQDGRMVVAIENPMQWATLDELRRDIKSDVEAVMATAADIAWAINKHYGDRHPDD